MARNLSQRYPGPSGSKPLTILEAVDLEIGRGEILAILGPSGSGKTTLLGLLAGLDRATDGTIEIEGQSLGEMSEDERAALRATSIGFVFQSFQLVPTLTALENVLVPLELLGHAPENGREAHATELLERVGLGGRVGHYPAQLSGGEQQRVGIARAFANQPRILFADEPTGNLDGETGHGIVELLFDLNRERNTTLVIVTHDLALARRANRILHLGRGRIEKVECVR